MFSKLKSNKDYYFFRPDKYFGGVIDIKIDDYYRILDPFLDHWRSQRMMEKDVFVSKPYGSNPFNQLLFTSKGRYDIANHFNGFGPTFLFINDRMIDIFANINLPEYELFPIKYRQKGNIYNGYFLGFTQDYSLYIDFQNSKICYKPYGHEYYIPVRFNSADHLREFINENASIRYDNGATNLGDFKFPEIRFQEFVYDMDIICIPFLITDFLMSERLKDIIEKEKISKINFMEWDNLYFKDGILVLAPNDCY